MTELIEGNMREVNELNLSMILTDLIDGTKDIDLKTEILKPKQLASLSLLGKFLSEFDFEKSSLIIKLFVDIYLRYMVSFNRESRKEIVRAIMSIQELKGKSSFDKLIQKIP